MEEIINKLESIISDIFNITIEELKDNRKLRSHTDARSILFYFLHVTALFNGVQFPFTVTRDMSIARADTRTVCITKEDVLQEIRVRKTDATNQLKSLDRYNKIVEECEKVEQELLGDDPSLGRISSDDNRILALEKKIEELTKIISNGINRRNEEITTEDVGDGK